MVSMWVDPLCTRVPTELEAIFFPIALHFQTPYDVVLLGGLSGRLDQTVHTLSYLHKLRKSGRRFFVVADENVGWVLDEARGFPSFFFLRHFEISRQDLRSGLRANIASPLITRY